MNVRQIIKANLVAFTIVVYVMLFLILHHFQPSFAYKKDGELRSFGIGYRQKTVLPMWIVSIVLAILIYLFMSYVVLV